MRRSLVPAATRRRRTDVRLWISFAAGVFLGVPLTYVTFFLSSSFLLSSSLQQAISSSSSLRQPIPLSSSIQQTIQLSSSFQQTIATVRVPFRRITRNDTDLIRGIFWTQAAESLVPRGFGEREVRQWRRALNRTRALAVAEGCGRMQNRLVVLDGDSSSCCCRYRRNNDQIQGEIFSFYLGRLLGLETLPPSALTVVDPRSAFWSGTAGQVSAAGWSSERPAVLTQFVPGLEPSPIPRQFRDSKSRRLHPEDVSSSDSVPDLVQWSDLVVFDYLTGNLDRVVNNMYNERWNRDAMSGPAHNLVRTPEGLLLFLDNESGLVHGYRLLDKYESYHSALLDSLCVFRKKTVRALLGLRKSSGVEKLLRRAFQRDDPGMSSWLPFLPGSSVRTLNERIGRVLRQVEICSRKFSRTAADVLV